ncbi:MAG: hypothetical protein ONB17_04410 [candidate division KSB1 bacterium]|nr:hypothetical protein [candidate division KSB1 bacterium]MDZ7385910.1 hypothetical protein [candidate division KSB1 bacterium]MDZ7392661.1 hypothetical protein [candidate division KSB1 bacterium]MDZ7412929.1 hypothetical protein [candidate division KSB1 bacterium]
MAKERPVYARKLSDEEVRGQYILVQRGNLDMFPKPGKPFKLKIGGAYHEATVLAVECWSLGPRKPTQTFRIDMRPFAGKVTLRYGHKVTIAKVKEGYYELLE